MNFVFEKERLSALSRDGIPMGHIAFPQIRPGLVNITHVAAVPEFRCQGVEEGMMEALLSHLSGRGQKAALTSPFAQQYVGTHSEWKHILPGRIHFGTH